MIGESVWGEDMQTCRLGKMGDGRIIMVGGKSKAAMCGGFSAANRWWKAQFHAGRYQSADG